MSFYEEDASNGILILPNGDTVMVFSDDSLIKARSVGPVHVQQTSLIEWEEDGFTVRAAHDKNLAIRLTEHGRCLSREGALKIFETRQEALTCEMIVFWDIVEDRLKKEDHVKQDVQARPKANCCRK